MNARELRLSPEALIAEQARQKAEKRAKSRRLAPRRKAGAEAKRLSKEERLERLARIRVNLWTETAGLCAACGLPLPFVTMHAHHLRGGEERRLDEREETMAPVHPKCHDNAHGKDGVDPLPTLEALEDFCIRTHRAEAQAATRRRIDKVIEARAAHPEARSSASEAGRP